MPVKRRPIIVGLGEVLWDLLPGGRQLGGAPANFACHAAALGAEARLVSRVGDDVLGRESLARLARLGVDIAGIDVDPTLPTGTVGVEVAEDGQPRFTIHERVAWDSLEVSMPAREAVASVDALCFGTLAQRSEPSRSTLQTLLASAPPEALRVFDVNLRQHYYSREIVEASVDMADVLKVNDAELIRIGDLLGLGGDERARMARLAESFGLKCVVCTRGAQGSLLYSEGRWSERPGVPTRVVDTIGAGDAFTAALTVGLLAGWPLDEVHRMAADLATYVCSQPGATPTLPDTFIAPFRHL